MTNSKNPLVIGVEGGGTKTDWVYLKHSETGNQIIDQGHLPPSNFRLVPQKAIRQLFASLPKKATHVGVFLAGCVTGADRNSLHSLVKKIWPTASIAVGSDRESGFATAFQDADGIAVISGTGSAVTGRKEGRIENAGGRGHLLGDRGGAYIISIEGLRLALRNYDLEHRITPLAENILRALSLNRMEDLIGWTQGADKKDISGLAAVLFEATKNGDRQMLAVIEAGATALAQYTQSVAQWLKFELPDVRLLGGLFLNQPMYVQLYRNALRSFLRVKSLEVCRVSGAMGAAYLASTIKFEVEALPTTLSASSAIALNEAITETTNPRSLKADRLSTVKLINLFVREESQVQSALAASRKSLQSAVDLLTRTFKKGGRLFYVGAGTSGRLGVLDASEIPPTFGEPSERVQAIIAGGPAAITNSVEGAEDEELQGSLSIMERGVRSEDVVCGISASGRTPFVLAALKQAKKVGAKTIFITCNTRRDQATAFDAEIEIATGPELIAGSTRLKCGTATKVALNILTTCSMIKLGKVRGNKMVNLKATNSKLKHRAVRLVSEIKKWPAHKAEDALRRHGWSIRDALEKE